MTSALLSIALNSIGYKAISMTGREAGIMTTDTHTKAKIEKIDTQKMKNALSEGNIIIVAGFQGVTLDGCKSYDFRCEVEVIYLLLQLLVL